MKNINNEIFFRIFEANRVPIIIFDFADGDIITVNQAACDFYLYTYEEFISLNINNIYLLKNEEYKSLYLDKINYEMQHILGNGLVVDVEIYPSLYEIENKKVIVFIINDITKRKQKERELKEKLEKIEKNEKTKESYFAHISHELRAPLNGIFGIIQLLENTVLTDTQRKLTDMAMHSANMMIETINNFLDLSKINAGKFQFREEEFNLYSLMNEIREIFIVKINQKKLKLNYMIDSNLPEFVKGDKVKLRQILNNIIGNAVKYTEKGSISIKVYFEKETDKFITLRFEISDTGIGIPENKKDSIFEEFSRIDDSFEKKSDGTGLGLTISKKLIELMNGTIYVESKFNEGSTFIFTVELKKIKNREEISNISEDNINILVIEDDEASRMVVKLFLNREKIKVDESNNGKDAFDKFNDNTYDLILLDIQLPEIDGITLLKKIRVSEKGKIPVIAMSAYINETNRQEFIDKGFNDIISKPFLGKKLIEVVKKYINI